MNDIELQTRKFINHCKYQRRLSSETVKAYGLDLKCFAEFIAGLESPVACGEDITRGHLQEYVTYLNQKFSVKTVRRRIASIRSFFHFLEEEEIISVNIFDKFHLNIKEPFHVPNTMSLEEISRILETAYSDSPVLSHDYTGHRSKGKGAASAMVSPNSREYIWVRDIAILELLFAGGLRVSELCKLKFEDISDDHMEIRINGKGNKVRSLYLENIEVVKALNRYISYREAVDTDIPFLFITKFYDPLSTQAVRNMVDKYTKMAGFKRKITPHVFRHSFASLLLEEGVDIKYIQDFLGHSSIATTQIYLHTTSNQQKRILSSKHPRQKLIMSDIEPAADFILDEFAVRKR